MANTVATEWASQASFAGRIGVARADITPPAGIYSRTWGAARHDVAESIHRPLCLSALTLAADAPSKPLLLIEADASWWQSHELWEQLQQRLLAEFSLEPAQLIFAVSHSHSAPPLAIPDQAMAGGDLLQKWLDQLWETTIDTVRQALQNAEAGILDWRAGRCQLASVRDLPEPGGAEESRRVVCGYNPQLPADDTLLVGRVTDAKGDVRATLCNYACHPTTLAWENTAISPDYVGAMRATIERETGAPALFLQGASGELAPRHQYVGDAQVADRHGRQLGYAALAALMDMDPPGSQLAYEGVVESGAPLALWRPAPAAASRDLKAVCTAAEVPLKGCPPVDELDRQWAAADERTLKERLRRRRNVRLAVGDGPSFTLPIWSWRVGGALLVGCMAESYSLLQRELRRRFADQAVVAMNLINGSIGYLPPEDAYDQNIYQVWQTPFARGSLEIVLEAMTDSLRRLTRAS